MPFSSLLLLELKRQMCLYTPVVPFIPDSRPKWVKSTPVLRPKRRKTIPFWAAHTYRAYIRKYPRGQGPEEGLLNKFLWAGSV